MKALPLLALLATTIAARGEDVWPDPAALAHASHPSVATRTIDLGRGATITATFALTEKGNGGLTIPGWGLRVYDAQRDGVTFEGYLLRCEWRDTNADGYLDLVVTGVAQHWTAKGDRIDDEKPLTAVFTYAPARKAFDLVQCPDEIFHWENRQGATERPTPTAAK